jgi:hypothetical protein
MRIKGSCHCGATQFTVTRRPATVTRCTCSFCAKRGAPWAYQDQESDFALTTARDRVSTYQWVRYMAEHHHCAICGCGTWSRSPAWDQTTNQPLPGKFSIAINAWLLDGFEPDGQPIRIVDGKNQW